VAISARLTFAPIVPVFAAIAWMNSRSANRRAALLRYVIGLTIGLSPALFFLVTSPQQFMFGNFDYPMLSTAYWIAMGNKTAAQPLAKLLFVLGHFVCEPENLFLIGAVLWILAANRGRLEPGRLITQRRFLPLLILYLLIGSFAPAPSFRPYFYAPIPFIVLWCVYTLADMPQQSSATRRAWRFSGCAAALAIVIGAASYRDISQLAQPNGWWPLKVHDAGVELARIAGNRRVLTFEPIYALEGGCDIYPQFATGVFAIRTAVTLVEDQEEEYRDWDDADLIECFEAHPPLAILIGNETESEQLVSRFVEKNGYKANPLHLDREVLWISPQSARAEIEYSKTSGLSAHDADADPAGGR
jgi:hypothetical protein